MQFKYRYLNITIFNKIFNIFNKYLLLHNMMHIMIFN